MSDNVVAISSNSFTTATTSYQVPVASALYAPTEVVVVSDVQMVVNPSGSSTQYWNLIGGALSPTSSTYGVVVGGSSFVTNEMFRVVGKVNATSISIGTDAYGIYTLGGNMYLQDTFVTKKLSDFGGVGSVGAGAGLNFTTITGSGNVIMGTPSAITSTSANIASGTTHTHAIDATIINSGTTYANPSWITSLSETKVLASQSGKNGYYYKSNGTSGSWQPMSLSNDVFAFSGTSYTPYTYQVAGSFDNTSINPSAVNRLNYNGNLYATNLYGNHVVGGTNGDIAYTNGSYIKTGVGNYSGTTFTVYGNILANTVYVGNSNTYISNNGSSMSFTDSVSGTKTLAQILSGATNFWTSTTNGLYYAGNVNIGGTTFTGQTFGVSGNIAATNFLSSIYRWRNGNICIGSSAGDMELNSDKFYCDITNTSSPMLYGDFDLRYWQFNGDTYWGVNKHIYFGSTNIGAYSDSTNLFLQDTVSNSGNAIPLVNLINGTYNALKSDFTNYSGVTGISATNISQWNTAYSKSSVITLAGSGTTYLASDGTYKPISASVTLNDNILNWYGAGGYYRPYITKGAGHFYNTDTTAPSNTNQLFYP